MEKKVEMVPLFVFVLVWMERKSMNLKIIVLVLQCSFAQATDVLMLDAIFIIKVTTNSLEVYLHKQQAW